MLSRCNRIDLLRAHGRDGDGGPYLVERDPDVVVPEHLADAEPLRRDREDLGGADDLDVQVAVVGGVSTLDLGALPQAVVVVERLDHVPGAQVARHRRGRRARPDRLPRDAPGHLAVAVVPPYGVRVAVAPRDLPAAPRAHRRPGLLRPHLHRIPFLDPHRATPPPPALALLSSPLYCYYLASSWSRSYPQQSARNLQGAEPPGLGGDI